jgi:hypothetical protein
VDQALHAEGYLVSEVMYWEVGASNGSGLVEEIKVARRCFLFSSVEHVPLQFYLDCEIHLQFHTAT